MFISGVGIHLISNNVIAVIANDIVANVPLLVLFILVSLISIPLKIAGYFDSVEHFMKKLRGNPRKLYACISFSLFFLGPILHIGVIRLFHEMIKDLKIDVIILAKSYIVGFSTVLLWSPYVASVALVL